MIANRQVGSERHLKGKMGERSDEFKAKNVLREKMR